MITANTVDEVLSQVRQWKTEGKTIGLVPTMGYLHEGHASLMKRARKENDKVIVSIFVNPIQFGPTEDLASYPRDFERDRQVCSEMGVDLIFHPQPEGMYAEDFCTYVDMDVLTTQLCGKSRPTHFRGVLTVVSKLFHIAQPDRAYFGEKDAQQLAVIRRMVRDLNFNLKVVGCPIVREADGLAKSSRNTYLNETERKAALVLSCAIDEGKRLLEAGEKDAARIVAAMRAIIEAEPLARIDYVELVDGDSLQPLKTVAGTVLGAVAVYIGTTRLIDNTGFIETEEVK